MIALVTRKAVRGSEAVTRKVSRLVSAMAVALMVPSKVFMPKVCKMVLRRMELLSTSENTLARLVVADRF